MSKSEVEKIMTVKDVISVWSLWQLVAATIGAVLYVVGSIAGILFVAILGKIVGLVSVAMILIMYVATEVIDRRLGMDGMDEVEAERFVMK